MMEVESTLWVRRHLGVFVLNFSSKGGHFRSHSSCHVLTSIGARRYRLRYPGPHVHS